MKRTLPVLLLAIVLLLNFSTTAFAAAEMPVGQCPTGFEPHHAMDHNMDGHKHAGLKVDLNKDGIICVFHVSDTTHVHVDNVVR